MWTTASPSAALVGRVLIGLIFLLSGVMKFADWHGNLAHMEAKGMTVATPLFLGAAALVEIAGGLALWAGCCTRAMALVLTLFLIPTTLIFHNFWAEQGAARQNDLFNFLKNIAIMGGLLMTVAHGAGAYSVDERYAREREPRTRPGGEPAFVP
jgi:putative oxidoreductase